MAKTINDEQQMTVRKRLEVEYKPMSAFFGLIRWEKRLSTTTIGSELLIAIEPDAGIDKVIINGREVVVK